jgi:hypothetical protein
VVEGRDPAGRAVRRGLLALRRYRRIVSIARYSTYDYRPSRRQHANVRKLILAVARDRAPAAPAPPAPPVTRPDPAPPPQPPPEVPGSGGKPPPAPTPTPTPRPTTMPRPEPTLPPLPPAG